MNKNNLQVTIHPVKLDSNNFQPYIDFDIYGRIYYEAQQDGHGPFPTVEDHLDKVLEEAKTEVLKQISIKNNGEVNDNDK